MLEARTVRQGEVPTGCVTNTVRCIGQGKKHVGKSIPYGSKVAMHFGSPYGIATRNPVRLCWKSRTVVYNLGQ